MATIGDLNKIDIGYVKSFLGIPEDDESFDDQISIISPFYAQLIIKDINADLTVLTDEDIAFIYGMIAVGIGCHLMKSNPEYGLKSSGWKLGEAAKSYMNRNRFLYDDWCTYYDELFNEFQSLYASAGTATYAERQGLKDSFDVPY